MILALNNINDSNYSRTHPFSFQDSYNTYHNNHSSSSTSSNHLDVLDSTNLASSSPLSTYSYQPSTPLATGFDIPRRPNHQHNISQSLSQVPDLMPSTEQWLVQNYQQTPRGTQQRLGHNRESSLSSLNSNGPASPYDANTSNPQIALNDSTDGFNDLAGGDSNYSYQLGKPLASDNFYTSIHALSNQGNGLTDMSFADGLTNMAASQQQQQQQQQQQHKRFDRGLLPAADVSSVGSTTRSHPASVASSTVGGDSQPATPSFQEPTEDETRRRKNGEIPNSTTLKHDLLLLQQQADPRPFPLDHLDYCTFTSSYFDDLAYHNAPKLDRTMTDVYSDELYSPHFTITSASPQPQSQAAMSPNSGVFAERLALANNQHLSAVQSPASSTSRTNSPFRHGSPLAPSSHDFPQMRLSSAQQVREKQKQEHDANALQEQLTRTSGQQQGTPSTISPKDAMLDYNDNDEASNFPLFPSHETNNFDLDQLSRSVQQQKPKPSAESQQTQQQQRPQQQPQPSQPRQQLRVPLVQQRTPLQTAFDFSMPTNIQMPQQYPFVSRPRQQQGTPSVSTFSRMSSAETNGSSGSDVGIQRPAKTGADGGTYTCTYHGCTLRFETPQLLQKHKREGHRQANALTTPTITKSSMPASPDMPDTLLGSQAGPHRCDRINPSTGKPCATVFSRPYDLTRHEDTIHNARKKKVRCNLCTEEKTFSRADALTRHYRVCHPDVEFPGKHRRRGGSAAA